MCGAYGCGDGDRQAEAALLKQALGLWRGEPLADVPLEVPLREMVVGLGEQRLAVLGQRIAAELAVGRHGELVAELRALLVCRNPTGHRPDP